MMLVKHKRLQKQKKLIANRKHWDPMSHIKRKPVFVIQ